MVGGGGNTFAHSFSRTVVCPAQRQQHSTIGTLFGGDGAQTEQGHGDRYVDSVCGSSYPTGQTRRHILQTSKYSWTTTACSSSSCPYYCYYIRGYLPCVWPFLRNPTITWLSTHEDMHGGGEGDKMDAINESWPGIVIHIMANLMEALGKRTTIR